MCQPMNCLSVLKLWEDCLLMITTIKNTRVIYDIFIM